MNAVEGAGNASVGTLTDTVLSTRSEGGCVLFGPGVICCALPDDFCIPDKPPVQLHDSGVEIDWGSMAIFSFRCRGSEQRSNPLPDGVRLSHSAVWIEPVEFTH